MSKKENWLEAHSLTSEKLALARRVLDDVRRGLPVMDSLRRHPAPGGGYLGKHALVAAYQQMVQEGELSEDVRLLERIRLKPVRTLSGVTTVTVLTKPYPCPGKCVFCPTDARMPKSYLPDEPGAMRGLEHDFDPYAQVRSRLEALEAVGHPTDKIELLILGGTWSAYRRDYQEWFVRRCFEALNAPLTPCPSPWGRGEGVRDTVPPLPQGEGMGVRDTVSPLPQREGMGVRDTVSPPPQGEGMGVRDTVPPLPQREGMGVREAQTWNETAPHRNVGLVVETRPDEITPDELRWLRHLGVTKVQMGAQSLDDRILALNQRGHDVATTRRAVSLLRAAGFKIVLHWMPNLLGATLDSDRADFSRLWDGLCPDEIKIYPTQLLANAELYAFWQRGEYQPYTTQELIDLIADIKVTIPRYCRVNRVIRDIPSTRVVQGNRRTSLRQDVQRELRRRGMACQCVRCREVRGKPVRPETLRLDDLVYSADGAEEHFLSFVTPDDHLAGFLRLSLPRTNSPQTGLEDLRGAALVRELHVYGQSLPVGAEQEGAAQHAGLGTQLLETAERLARQNGFERLAVISAVGTRQYYLERGFERGALYLLKRLQ